MTLIPYGVDSTTGVPRPVAADEGLVGVFVPSPDSWGTNTEDLSATKTLTDSSKTVQFLNPSGAERVVQLPMITLKTPFFVIFNDSLLDNFDLVIQDSTGLEQARVVNGEAIRLIHNGSDVVLAERIENLTTMNSVGRLRYAFGQSSGVNGRFFTANIALNIVATLDYSTQHTVSEAGTIDFLHYNVNVADDLVLKIHKNGSVVYTSPTLTDLAGSLAVDVAVAAGDRIGVELDASATVSTLGWFVVSVEPSAPGSWCSMTWGADVNVLTHKFAANGGSTAMSRTTFDENTEHVAAEALTIESLGWINELGDATTDYAIYKNGALSETVDATGTQGAVGSLSTSLAVADTVAIRVDTKTTGEGVVSVACSGASGTLVAFGGDAANNPGRWYAPTGSSDDVASASLTDRDQQTVPKGLVNKFSLHYEIGSGGSTWRLWKNGAASEISETNDSTKNTVVRFSTGTRYLYGDVMAFELESVAPAPRNCIIGVLLESGQ